MIQTSEHATVQAPLIRYAVEAGWTWLEPERALSLRGGEHGLLLRPVFLEAVQRLNPGRLDPNRAEDLARRLERVAPNLHGNLEAWEYLRGLKTVFIPEEKRERNVTLIAPDWRANTYHVTSELRYVSPAVPHPIRLDAAFFINGIPILLVETKAAHKIDGIAEALEQVRRYHRDGAELLALMQMFALTHLVQFYYGPTWNTSPKAIFNWKSELQAQAAAPVDFESLVKTFVHPERVVRVLLDYILFVRREDELSKVILRPHQMRAVERILHRAAEPEKRRGLIWHTQGSGKTYTMIVAARKILENPYFENPTVLMLVDRNELEAQLFANLAAVGFGHVRVAESKAHLRQLLREDYRGLIVSMIHKFDDMPANLNPRTNIFILVDEAHRTTGGDLGNYLAAALPNATWIGFTGTPIDQTAHGKGTFKIFGLYDPKGYLDKYSIAESIADGTTVPLHYALAPSELRVDRETLEREFLDLKETAGISDIELLNQILERAVTLRNMLKNHDRMDRIARYVAEHYRTLIEPMGYKAFLVAVDREACALYKDLLDRYLPSEYSEVVISPNYNDPEFLRRFHYSDEKEQAIRKAFRQPDALPKILIVTEKLLTGFDAPILYAMYLDKPMRDHVLLQAIARVNRPYEDVQGRAKPCGLIVDFVGIFEKLERALAFDSQDVADVQSVVTALEKVWEHFETLMRQARAEFLPAVAVTYGDKGLEAVLNAYRDEERRQNFYRFFREVQSLYEILSPDARLRPYLEDYQTLAWMYLVLRSAYESLHVDRELTRKTARLVQEHTHGTEIRPVLQVYEINERLLEKLTHDDTPDTVKVFNLLKSIEDLIRRQGQEAPYLISIGERAQQIAEAYRQRLVETQAALRELEALVQEIVQAEHERRQMGLSPLAFAAYWLLTREGYHEAAALAEQVEAAFQKYPYFRLSRSQDRDLRRNLYALLGRGDPAAGAEKLKERVEALLRMVTRVEEGL
ncbi:HsdR family type I site-specific deoxyribonuclease [Thermanaerothrix sp.]|uniref:type I restriction endonuclease subunit R n=1 Tax=Thermanaerothrix sp. TaxID=2972675 RepID=UPI002ADE6FAA|nr:HsdR family type I site-specific deoxyribonuclease [Thermanaerothrix sp.]